MPTSKTDLLELVEAARAAKALSYRDLAALVGRPPVWTAAALHGQHPMTAEDARTLGEALGLDADAIAALQRSPNRGEGLPAVPTDPTIYRFHEALQVYGTALKALIHEEFGDGIMSAINFSMTVEREEHPDGDRVAVRMSGKFLPYDWVE
jgi:cyanate lyase